MRDRGGRMNGSGQFMTFCLNLAGTVQCVLTSRCCFNLSGLQMAKPGFRPCVFRMPCQFFSTSLQGPFEPPRLDSSIWEHHSFHPTSKLKISFLRLSVSDNVRIDLMRTQRGTSWSRQMLKCLKAKQVQVYSCHWTR